MLISVQHLVDRLRHPRSRADEVAEVRHRLVAQPGPQSAPASETEVALEVRRLKVALSAALDGVESCRSCSRGHPLPAGRWSGGHCCSGRTAELFRDDEVAALRQSGTSPSDLAPPRSDHAGCAFRGPTGCSLEPAHRPTLCVRYLCLDLRAELDRRGDLREIKRAGADLQAAFERFTRLRSARLAK